MGERLQDVLEDIENLVEEPEIIGQSRHKMTERVFLPARNICAAISTVLFLLSFFLHHAHSFLRGFAYISGAIAYFFELGILTDNFTRKVSHRDLFMAYCFGPLYLLMGLAYLLE